MILPALPALIGAGASILGGVLSGKGKKKFRGFDVSNPLGSASINKQGELSVGESAFSGGARSFFEDQFRRAAGDPFGQQAFGGQILTGAQGMFGPAFEAAQGAGFDLSNQGVGAFTDLVGSNIPFLGDAARSGINQAFASPFAAGAAGQAGLLGGGAGAFGLNLLGQAGDQDALIAQTKSQLDALAQPAESRAVNQKFGSLFGSGRLGTTGGAQALGQLDQALQLADTDRARQAAELGLQNRNQLLSAGQGLLGTGISGIGTQLQGIGLDQQRAASLGSLGRGLFGDQFLQASGGLEALIGADTRNIGLQSDRLSRVEGLFGFGQNQFEQPVAGAARTLTGLDPLNQNLSTLSDAALRGASIRSGIAPGGGAASAAGGALQGLGSGLFNAGIQSFFNK